MAKTLYDSSLINSTLLEMLETQGYSDYIISLKLAIEKINAKVIATNGVWTKKKLQDIKNLIEIEITKSYGGLFTSVQSESVTIAQVTYASILGASLALELPTEAVKNLLDPKLKVRMSQPFTNKKGEGKTGVYTLAKLFGVEEQGMIRRMQIAVASGITASDSVAKIIKGVEFEGSSHRGGRLRSNIFTMVTNARNEGNYSAYRNLEDDDVIKYYEHNSTLDSSTSAICRVLDGRRYFMKFDNISSNLKPPLHGSCRSTLIPRTTFDAQERTSSNGIIPSEKYPTFFKKQDKAFQIKVLGKKKYELYKKGQYKMVSVIDAIGSRKIDINNYKESLISLTK